MGAGKVGNFQSVGWRRGYCIPLLAEFFELRFNPVVNPMGVPPFHRVHGNSIQQHGEVQVVAARKPGLTAAANFLARCFT